MVEYFLTGIADHLKFGHYGEAIIHSPKGLGKEENQGFDAFLPLIDSGISLYIWTARKFFAIVLFTCKEFNAHDAVSYTRTFFNASKIEHMEY